MRSLIVAVLALLAAGCARPAWEQGPPPVRTGPVVDAARFTRGRLPNGLTLMVFEDPRLPLAVWGVTLRRGAGIESVGEAGLATFTAALMERGAAGRDAVSLARSVDDLGASLDVAAAWDTMTVQVSGLSRDADALFGVLGDVVLRPDFEPAEADSVRAEQLAAIEKERDEPASLAQQALARVLYEGHRYALPPGGEAGAVAGLSAADARSFHTRVFVPANAILFAAGDVTWADVEARARATFGAWPEGPVPERTPPPPPVTPEARRVVLVDRPDLGQAQVLLGHEGIARDDPERLAAGFMSRVLGGGGFTSRLMARIRKDEGLTYGIYSGFAMRSRPGPFFVSTFTRVPEVGRLVEIVLEELERMRDEPIGDAEVESVKRQSAGVFVLSLETSVDVLDALVDLDVYGLPEDSLDTYRARVVATTTEDVNRQARERLHPDRIALVVVGPAEALREQLEAFGPVEVVQP